MPSLPLPLFWSLSRCPQHLFYEDQWGEHGWVYDPRRARYCCYDIDRKGQHDSVSAEETRASFTERVLPRAGAPLRAWFGSFQSFRTDDEELIAYTDRDEVHRFGLGALGEDAYGRPVYPVEVVDFDAVLRGQALSPAQRSWLQSVARKM